MPARKRANLDAWAEFLAKPDAVGAWQFDPALMMADLGLTADPWQVEFLNMNYRRALLLCSRRSGKTTVVAVKALHHALFAPAEKPATVLLFGPGGDQTKELLYHLHRFYRKLGQPVERETDRKAVLDFANGSRIIPFAANPDTVVGYTPTLVIVDEAARVLDELYEAILPMRSLGNCQLVAVSTPHGKKGWFYHAWTDPRQEWYRVRKTADDCPRIDRKVIEEDRISRGELFVRQDYYCSFEVLEGLVYPDLPACVADLPASGLPEGRFFAGVDWGFHNPACVLVGLRTADDVLWIIDETYKDKLTNEDLTRRACAVADRYRIEMFYCDPAEPGSIEMFRRNNLPAKEGMNRILPGIQAVTARINTGRLKVLRSCVNLLAEAGLYRYPNETERRVMGENPVDENNHAMAALRYMVAGIDRVRELHARAPQVIAPEPPPAPDPNIDYRIPIQREPAKPQRIKSVEEQFDESEDAKRLQRDHIHEQGWESWGGSGATNW